MGQLELWKQLEESRQASLEQPQVHKVRHNVTALIGVGHSKCLNGAVLIW
jgi:hypothetical protein